MVTKVFKEYKVEDGVNDTLTISKRYGMIKFRISCGRKGCVQFNQQQLQSIVNYLCTLIE
jgi:hypothetical protein